MNDLAEHPGTAAALAAAAVLVVGGVAGTPLASEGATGPMDNSAVGEM